VATLTGGAAAAGLLAPGGAVTSGGRSAASWPAPDGTQRDGYLRVARGTPAGARVAIWVDGSGAIVRPPRTTAEVTRSAVVTGVGIALGGTVVVLLGIALLRWRLERRRMRAWDAAWAAVEPIWSRPRF
jgi:hypothetical protein